MRHNTPTTLFFSCSVGILMACASQARSDFGVAPSGSLDIISGEEIASSHGTTAYEVVERTHPMFLFSKVGLAPTAEREVYLNGVRLGGVVELRSIPATEVSEIRFVRAVDGSAYGVGRSGGAILVISKSGR